MTNDEAYVKALHAELAYMKAQPGDRKDRVKAIEAEIDRVSPGKVETASVEAPEKAVVSKPRPKKAE